MQGGRIGTLLVTLAAGALVVILSLLPRWNGSSAHARSGKPVVQVWGWNIAAMSLEKLTVPFEAKHPDVDVEITRDGTNMQTRLLLSLSANTGAPDITELQQV